MTVLLVLLTFATFILIDYFVHRHEAAPERTAVREVAPSSSPKEPVWVAGFELPDDLHYHPGHTWARLEGDGTVVVGIDAFASQLLGAPRRLELPTVGAWLRQGAPSADMAVDGRKAHVVSPVEGEVIAVNRQLEAHPELAQEDPYGRGWLFKVRSSDLATSLRNLLSGRLAHRWMEEARERLDLNLMALSASVLQDGGAPVADFARHLTDEDWRRLIHTFLLT